MVTLEACHGLYSPKFRPPDCTVRVMTMHNDDNDAEVSARRAGHHCVLTLRHEAGQLDRLLELEGESLDEANKWLTRNGASDALMHTVWVYTRITHFQLLREPKCSTAQ